MHRSTICCATQARIASDGGGGGAAACRPHIPVAARSHHHGAAVKKFPHPDAGLLAPVALPIAGTWFEDQVGLSSMTLPRDRLSPG